MNYFNQETERLRLRKLTSKDIPGWVDFFIENSSLKYLGLDLTKSNEELAEHWINIQLKRYVEHGLGHLAIELKANGAFIGMGGLLPRNINGKDEYEIAYSLKPAYWGYGYATEIASKIKSYASEHVDSTQLISIIHIDNEASAHVARKNGMTVAYSTNFLGMEVDVYSLKNDTQ